MNAHNTFFMTGLHLYIPKFSALYGLKWEESCVLLMLGDIFPL